MSLYTKKFHNHIEEENQHAVNYSSHGGGRDYSLRNTGTSTCTKTGFHKIVLAHVLQSRLINPSVLKRTGCLNNKVISDLNT